MPSLDDFLHANRDFATRFGKEFRWPPSVP
jgi:hypothetical protein